MPTYQVIIQSGHTKNKPNNFIWFYFLVLLVVLVLSLMILNKTHKKVYLAELKNDLVANVSHELKTPLSGMRLLLETLLSNEKLSDKQKGEYLHLIAGENLRLSQIVEKFLTFSRLENQSYQFERKTNSDDSTYQSVGVKLKESKF